MDTIKSHILLATLKNTAQDIVQFNRDFIQEHKIIKYAEDTQTVSIAIAKKDTMKIVDSIRGLLGKKVKVYLTEESCFSALLNTREESYEQKKESSEENDRIYLNKIANDAPIINIVNRIFIDAIHNRASDIHFETDSTSFYVRYRIDGQLVPIEELERSLFAAVSCRLKIMANLNIMEKRRPQDGRFSVDINSDKIDVRISTVPLASGESIVCRVLHRCQQNWILSELGFKDKTNQKILHLLKKSNGMILVTGPTGSGKSTTLNAMLNELSKYTRKIITIEDPVEYHLSGVSQIQINEKIGLSFHALLKQVLRQDPDIIMIGEIRDKETAELAVRAALTGHLVLSTLHTQDALSTVQRLENLGVKRYLLAAVLKGIVAQRLVRRLCPLCKTEATPSSAERKLLKGHGIELQQVSLAKGCVDCYHTGYRGRFAVSEVLCIEQEEQKLMTNADHLILAEHVALKQRQELLDSAILQAVEEKTVSLDDAFRILTL